MAWLSALVLRLRSAPQFRKPRALLRCRYHAGLGASQPVAMLRDQVIGRITKAPGNEMGD